MKGAAQADVTGIWYLPPRDRIFPVERGYESLPEEIKERYKDVGLDG